LTRLNAANNAQALLVGDITSADTSFYVDDASAFPTAPFMVTIDNEIILVNTVLVNLFSSVTRAQESTTAAAHIGDSLVENRWTAGMYDALAILEDVPQNNFAATANATVNDDSSAGYGVGSTWINVALDTAYVCLDAAVGAAVWELISGLAAHLSETVSYVHPVVERDISLTGDQVISLVSGRTPKTIKIFASITGVPTASWGIDNYCMTQTYLGNASDNTYAIYLLTASATASRCTVTKSEGSITLTWNKSGTPTGTARLIIEAIYHD